MILELVVLIIIGYLTRILFILTSTSDLDVHLWMISFYKNEGKLGNKTVKSSLFPGFVGYPPIPHILIAKLPEKLWLPVAYLLNLTMDIFTAVVLYFVASYVNSTALYIEGLEFFTFEFYVTLVFLTTPLLHPLNARLKAIGGRTISSFLLFLYFLLLAIIFIYDNYMIVPFSIVIGLLVIMSSQFGMQVLVFFSIGMAWVYFDTVPLMLLFVIFIVGWTIPQLGVKKQLIGKYYHYKWYFSKFNGRTGDQRGFTKYIKIFLVLFVSPSKAFKDLIRNNPFFIIFYSLPTLVILLYYMFSNNIFSFDSQFIEYSLNIVVVCLVIFLATSFRPFTFLGQAERYLEYTIPFISVLFVYLVSTSEISDFTLYIIILGQVMLVIINYLLSNINILKEKMQISHDKQINELKSYLKNSAYKNVICVPLKLSAKVSIGLEDKKWYHFHVFHQKFGLQETLKDCVSHHIMKPCKKYWAAKYEIELIVFEKKTIKFYSDKELNDLISESNKVFENEKYTVYRILNAKK